MPGDIDAFFDSDISSYFLRGRFNLSDAFEKKGFENIRVSRVTVAELEVLAHRNPESRINPSAIRAFAYTVGIIEIDVQTWQQFSLIKKH